MLFLMTACTPQLPSTTWVTPKSTATDISEIASSSLKPLRGHEEVPHLPECITHGEVDRRLLVDLALRVGPQLREVVGIAEAVEHPLVLGLEQRIVEPGERGAGQACPACAG